MDSSPVVVLDVGGTCFRTTKTTLTTVDSFFSRMVASDVWREGSGSISSRSCNGGSCSSQGDSSTADTSGESETPRSKAPPPSSSHSPAYIFIDRDPLCFPAVLSFLRSQQAFLPQDCDRAYLEKLACEADYYQLDGLVSCVREEIATRDARKGDDDETMDSTDVYRAVQPGDVNAHFEQGWAFVSSYEANETAACSATGSKVVR